MNNQIERVNTPIRIVIPATPAPRRALSRHKKVCIVVGAAGIGLWVCGWAFFGSAHLGLLGLCLIGITAIFSSFTSGGGGAVSDQTPIAQPQPDALDDNFVAHWYAMPRFDRLREWPRLSQREQHQVAAAAVEKMKAAHAEKSVIR